MKILKLIDSYLFGEETEWSWEKLWYYGPLGFGIVTMLFVLIIM